MIARRYPFVNNFFRIWKNILVLIIQHTVTVALEVGIRHLFPEFLADALVLLTPLQPAGTVAAGALQSFLYHLYHFLIFVQSNCHGITSLPRLL